MSKEEWFEAFEELEAEHPELSDEELSERAHEVVADRMATKIDETMDRMKYGEL